MSSGKKSLTSWTENNKKDKIKYFFGTCINVTSYTKQKYIYLYTSWMNNSHADQDFEVKYFQNIQINKSNLYLSSRWTFSARQTVDRRTTASPQRWGCTATPNTQLLLKTPQLSKNCQPSIPGNVSGVLLNERGKCTCRRYKL